MSSEPPRDVHSRNPPVTFEQQQSEEQFDPSVVQEPGISAVPASELRLFGDPNPYMFERHYVIDYRLKDEPIPLGSSGVLIDSQF